VSFNVICGERETGKLLVDHTTPVMVSITGSVRAGTEVATAAASQLKRVHLELGGKAPVVVFDDADLDAAAEGIAVAGFFNSGQDCTAATRVLVQAGVYDAMVAKLADQATNNIAVGMPDSDALVGPLNNANQLARVKGFVDRTPAHAKIVAGGKQLEQPGYFFAPTVIADLKQDDEMIQNEIFGPVITIQKFQTEEEAISLANALITAWLRASGPRIMAAQCAYPEPSISAASGSIPIFRSWPKCHTAALSVRAMAKIYLVTVLKITLELSM